MEESWKICSHQIENSNSTQYHIYFNIFYDRSHTEPPLRRTNTHHIEFLPGTTHLFKQVYGLSEKAFPVFWDYIYYVKSSQLEDLSSSTGALIHFIRKKNASLRNCVDYWSLNNDLYLFPQSLRISPHEDHGRRIVEGWMNTISWRLK